MRLLKEMLHDHDLTIDLRKKMARNFNLFLEEIHFYAESLRPDSKGVAPRKNPPGFPSFPPFILPPPPQCNPPPPHIWGGGGWGDRIPGLAE